jgi:hypothetical protein
MRVCSFWAQLLLACAPLMALYLPALVHAAQTTTGSALVLALHEGPWQNEHLQDEPAPGLVSAELRLPLNQLEMVFGEPLVAYPVQALMQHREALQNYVRRHLAVRAPDGRSWRVEVGPLALALQGAQADLVVPLRLNPPEGAPLQRFTLYADIIGHQLPQHELKVSVRRGGQDGLVADAPRLLGTLRALARSMSLDLSPVTPKQDLTALLGARLDSLAQGANHLLVVLMFLLFAPRVMQGIRRLRQ